VGEMATTEKKVEANRRNALHSTGPKSEEGVLACKNNALRHGLRAVQTLVPGEDPDEWAGHRDAVVADLRPVGAVELALAEDVAVKLWRLGRVVRYEADLIANAQDPDELALAHERAHDRHHVALVRTDIPTRKDVAKAAKEHKEAEEKRAERDEAIRQLEALTTMADDDAFPDWSLYVAFRDDFFRREQDVLEELLEGEDTEAAFLARHARKLIDHVVKSATASARRGGWSSDPEEFRRSVAEAWGERRAKLEKKALDDKATHKSLRRRYEAALERRRRAAGLPGPDDLNRIQRYEAHLERGLHKALDRLRDLQEGRGAVAPRGPSVALAVVQTGSREAVEGLVGSFGRIALEGGGEAQERDERGTEG
jgi:hypothetical protein